MAGSSLLRYNVPGWLYAIQTRHSIDCRLRVFKLGRTGNVPKRLVQYPKGSELRCCVPVSRMVDAETMLLALCRIRFIQRKDFGKEYFEGDLLQIMQTMLSVADQFRLTTAQDGMDAPLSCVVTDEDTQSGSEWETESDDSSNDLDSTEVVGDVLLEDAGATSPTAVDERAEEEASLEQALAAPVLPTTAPKSDPTVLLLQYIQPRLPHLTGHVETAQLLDEVTQMYRTAGCRSSPTLKSLFRDLRHYFKCTETPLHTFQDGHTGHATIFPCVEVTVVDSKVDCTLAVFMELPDLDRKFKIECVEGEVTLLHDLRDAFESRMSLPLQPARFVMDAAVLRSRGFQLKPNTSNAGGAYQLENVCVSCKKIAKGGVQKCCTAYHQRRMKVLIYNMRLESI